MFRIRILLSAAIVAMAARAVTPGTDKLPMFFMGNQGQAPAAVRFMAKAAGLNAYFLRGEVLFALADGTVRERFEGADPQCSPQGSEPMQGRANFLVGTEDQWHVGVPIYGAVLYRGLYAGIDMVYRGNRKDLKSEFVVSAGADPSQIRLRYSGSGPVRIDAQGRLVIPTGNRDLREDAPTIYEERDGSRTAVEGRYSLTSDGAVSFVVGDYDHSRTLVIDPVLSYSTLLGGSNSNSVTALAVDGSGAAYISGVTASYDFPLSHPLQNWNAGGNDVFVAKLNPAGNSLVYCTYLGGSGDDRAYGLAVDASGSALVAGSTMSTNFPVLGPLQGKLGGGRNAFVAKLNPAGNGLLYSTYLGGNGSDLANGIAVDSNGNAYVVGDTTSSNFPTSGFQRTKKGVQNVFVTEISANGSRLLYSTYLGGSSIDHGAAIAVDASGSAYVTGSTYSIDFPIVNAWQPSNAGGQDVFVSRLSANGSALIYSTYLGGSSGTVAYPESGMAIAVDGSGNAYITGVTSSVDWPVLNPLQAYLMGTTDAFVSKLAPSGTLSYSTYLGGSGQDVGTAIRVDSAGHAYVAGYGYSTDLTVTADALQKSNSGGYDAFVSELSAAGNSLVYLSYLGGNGSDAASALALDSANNVYVAGWTLSTNFPVLHAYQAANPGNYGAFVTKLGFSSTAPAPPDLAIAVSHTGDFTQGQVGATYAITVSNVGTGPTTGTPISVTETVPAGLTATSMTGSGWSCTQPAGPCTRSDALAAGSTYPAITLSVNVSPTAAASVTNTVTVAGGGETNTGNDQSIDATTIQPSGGSGAAVSIWSSSAVPQNPMYNSTGVTLGVKFRSDVGGSISGLRFYKGAGNNGTHIGLLYSSSGTLLAQATFTGETSSGWQQMNLTTPLTIAANTTYIVAYWSGTGFAYSIGALINNAVDNAPLHALRWGVDGPNGVYQYGSAPQFPIYDGGGNCYWADVVFSSTTSGSAPDLTIATSHTGNFTQGQAGATYAITVSNVGTGPTTGTPISVTETVPVGLTATSMAGSGWSCTQPAGPCTRSDALAGGSIYAALTLTVNVSPTAAASVTNTVTVAGGGETNTGNDQSIDATTIQLSGASGAAVSIWSSSAVPQNPMYNSTGVTLGVKFRSDVGGSISGLRFYKGAGNNGTHIGLLYSSSGTLLAQATFTGETSSGWQQMNLTTPVTIAANTTYIVAYWSGTGFAYSIGALINNAVDNAPLHALRWGVDGPNGVYQYGSAPQFPIYDGGGNCYWADVVFSPSN